MQIINEVLMTVKSAFAVVVSAVMAFAPFIIPNYKGVPAVSQAISTVPVYHESTQLLTLAEDGVSAYQIVRGQEAYHSEIIAAQELQGYLKQITGALLPIVTDAEPASAREIVVGKTNRAADSLIDRQALGEDGFRIAVTGQTLLIAGGGTRGTLFGVYTFLEDYLGCRWFTPELEVVPAIDRAVIPANLDITRTPAFGFRHTSWFPAQDAAWRAKMKLNGSMTRIHGSTDESYTDLILFGGSDAGHTFNQFIPPALYFESNPEYFAMQEDGTRSSGQPCLSNPDVLELTKAGIAQWIEQYPRAKYLSVSQNDNWFYCRCPGCAEMDAAEGSPSGSMIAFVNKVADYAKRLNPDIFIHTFAYQYTVKPPKNIRPASNVAVQLCAIGNSHSEPYRISAPDFVADIKTWSELCPNLLIWDYNFNFAHFHTPFPDLRIIQPNVQAFYENGALGFYGQGNTQSLSGEFGELRAYMVAKLVWDPYLDMEKLTEEFLYFYYGPGYKNIQKYIALSECKRGYNFHIGSKTIMPVVFNPFHLAKAQAWFDACAAAAINDAQRERTERSALQLRYYASAERIGDFFPWNKNRIEAAGQLHEDFVRLGITHLREGPRMLERPDYHLPVTEWSE